MTRRLSDFIKGPFKKWIYENTHGDKPEKFWLLPCNVESPDYDELVQEGIRAFSESTWAHIDTVDEFHIGKCTTNGASVFCITATHQEIEPNEATEFGLIESPLHFLQKSALLTKIGLQLPTLIPNYLVTEQSFESDLEYYFPAVHGFETRDDVEEYSLVTFLRVLLCIEPKDSPSLEFSQELINLASLIPDNEHDWLFFQIFSAARSKRLENLYLEIYKLLEFFFPIANIFNLKNAISFSGSPLLLLENCRNQLSWNMNHNSGTKAALKYAGINFAEVLFDETLTFDDSWTALEREKKTNAFKASAMEILSDTRHTLTHQNFKKTGVERAQLERRTSALLSFLNDAFVAYRRDIIGR